MAAKRCNLWKSRDAWAAAPLSSCARKSRVPALPWMTEPSLCMFMVASMASRSPSREPWGGVPWSRSCDSGCL
eukprot:359151-Amphidinium_carterae.1